MGLDTMLSRVMYSIESQLTYRASNAATKKITGFFSKKKKEPKVEENSENSERKLILASAYVGFAASYCDGVLDDEELKAIENFKLKLVKEGKDDLAIEFMKIKGEKPTFEDAMKHVDDFPKDMLSFFEGLIEDILKADGDVSPDEKVFLDKWEKYKATRS